MIISDHPDWTSLYYNSKCEIRWVFAAFSVSLYMLVSAWATITDTNNYDENLQYTIFLAVFCMLVSVWLQLPMQIIMIEYYDISFTLLIMYNCISNAIILRADEKPIAWWHYIDTGGRVLYDAINMATHYTNDENTCCYILCIQGKQ